MSYGFVYILSNPTMPNIYKIGRTDRAPLQRVMELSSSTSCPEPFELVLYAQCEDTEFAERELHEQFKHYRISPNREFFKFHPQLLIELVCKEIRDFASDVTYCSKYHTMLFEISKEVGDAIR